jgi:hypothetical protein
MSGDGACANEDDKLKARSHRTRASPRAGARRRAVTRGDARRRPSARVGARHCASPRAGARRRAVTPVNMNIHILLIRPFH